MLFGNLGNLGNSQPFPQDQEKMPELDRIGRFRVMRTAGNRLDGECLGVGFLRKNIYNDRLNWRYSNFVVVLVLQGSGKYVDRCNMVYDLSCGSIFVRLPNIEHSNYVDVQSNYLECYLEIGPQLFQALNSLEQLPLTPPVQNLPPEQIHQIAERFWHLGCRLNHVPDNEFTSCIIESITLLNDLKNLAMSGESGSKYHDLVDLACQLLSGDFTSSFSLQKFCRRHSVGYENFRKLFRAQTGCSPGQYRIRCRINAAEMLLLDNQLSIKEIAELLGYNNSYEFSAQFKQYKNLSPGRFRTRHVTGK